MADDTLADLPEAIPLQRVSPVWRGLAVLGGVAVVMLIGGVLVLSVALAAARSRAAVAGLAAPPPGTFTVNTAPFNDDPEPAIPANAVNLPYPVQDDLNWRNQRVEKPEAQTNPGRHAFQRLGAEVWKVPSDASYTELVVAPDGAQVAFFQGNHLVVGPFAKPEKVELTNQPQRGGRWRGQPAPVQNSSSPTGAPAWSADANKVYFTCEDGLLRCYTLGNQNLETLPWRGDAPVPLGANQLVFFRSQPAPIVDAPGAQAVADPVEIVVADLGPNTLRIVQRATPVQYAHPAVAPDGKRLAVWTSTTPVAVWPKLHQLQLIDLGDGASQRVGTVTTDQPGPIAWTPDGAALVYQRDLDQPLPPDYLASPPADARFHDAGLFHCLIKDGVETRLNRGGGCGLGAVTADGGLVFVVAQPAMMRAGSLRLRQAPLQAVRDFAARTPAPPVRTAADWSALLQQVCKEANVADAAKARLTPALMAQLAERFSAAYRMRFREEAPDDLEGFDRQARETNRLLLEGADRRRLDLVLGAVRGEHLRTRHGAIWRLSETPGKRLARGDAPEQSPFAVAVEFARLNDTDGADDEDEDDYRYSVPALERILHDAEGRPLLLTNDPAAARAAVAKLADPDLQRGQDLLEKGQAEAGEKVLLALLERPAHGKNAHLALVVGRLLYEQHRLAAVEKVMTTACERKPADARNFNLLGLAQLDQEPRQALQAFKKALRCDLHYGPAWLNLAQAYCQAGDTPSAVACLRRFIETADYSPLTPDARRRLAALEAK